MLPCKPTIAFSLSDRSSLAACKAVVGYRSATNENSEQPNRVKSPFNACMTTEIYLSKSESILLDLTNLELARIKEARVNIPGNELTRAKVNL